MVNSFLNRSRLNRISHKRLLQSFIFCHTVNLKIADRSVFFDETGKRVRTKKEITDENGQIRKGCTVIKKGDVYESHLFKTKDERFKSEAFIAEAKEVLDCQHFLVHFLFGHVCKPIFNWCHII